MKKHISIFCAAIMLIGALSGCGQTSANAASIAGTDTDENANAQTLVSDASKEESSLSIVTTIFPEYDWVKEILGDNPNGAEVTMLLDNGVDLHSYQPTAEDIMKIASCDVFIYVGGESDEWVDDALKEATNKDMEVINLLEVLGDAVKEEEVVEGMEAEDEHEHGEEDGEHEHEEEEEEVEYDEHVWLSLRNASVLCNAIEEAIAKADPSNAEVYKSNTDAYVAKLNELDKQYEEAVNAATNKTLLFGDRFPFRYLVDDYGLTYYAAFVGCSAETEASFETITFLSSKVDELGLSSIMVIESSDQKIANTIKDNTKTKDQQILMLDSMQSTTSKDVENGENYYQAMADNLEVLKKALN